MSGTSQNLVAELKRGIEAQYSGRLRGLYLYGSYARGQQESDSDLDVLIVLDPVRSSSIANSRGHGIQDEFRSDLTSLVEKPLESLQQG